MCNCVAGCLTITLELSEEEAVNALLRLWAASRFRRLSVMGALAEILHTLPYILDIWLMVLPWEDNVGFD